MILNSGCEAVLGDKKETYVQNGDNSYQVVDQSQEQGDGSADKKHDQSPGD